MSNVLENIVASIIVTIVSTIAGLIFQAFGFNAQTSVSAAGVLLFALVVLFVVAKRFYPKYIRRLTERLLNRALSVSVNETDAARIMFKRRIVERVLLESSVLGAQQNNSIIEFPNQETCESQIRDAFRDSKKVKILTIRGEKYFSGSKSLLRDLCLAKQGRGFSIEVLVRSPESRHITNELAESLGHSSVERTRRRMHNVLDNLKHIGDENPNFLVKCYDEIPIFKLLLFDDIMFVSAIIGPKNDLRAKMWRITQEGNPLFSGFERYFDDLSKRASAPDEVFVRRV